jgi:hypothetical protein
MRTVRTSPENLGRLAAQPRRSLLFPVRVEHQLEDIADPDCELFGRRHADHHHLAHHAEQPNVEGELAMGATGMVGSAAEG